MFSTFWSNTVWYVSLGVTSVILIAFILYKCNERKFMIGFSFAVLGATFVTETILLIILNAYNYLPKISSRPFVDSIIGNYFSQFSLTITAVFIIVYNLPTAWSFGFACTYYCIEELFLKLGIYHHFWYKSWYTFIGTLLMFWIIKKCYYHMLNLPKYFIYYISLYTGASAIFSLAITFWFYAFSIQVININFYIEFFRNQAILTVLYRSILTIIMIILYRMKLNWMWNGIVFVFLFILQYVLTKINVMTIKDGWFVIITLLDLFGCYFGVLVMHYLFSKRVQSN